MGVRETAVSAFAVVDVRTRFEQLLDLGGAAGAHRVVQSLVQVAGANLVEQAHVATSSDRQ